MKPKYITFRELAERVRCDNSYIHRLVYGDPKYKDKVQEVVRKEDGKVMVALPAKEANQLIREHLNHKPACADDVLLMQVAEALQMSLSGVRKALTAHNIPLTFRKEDGGKAFATISKKELEKLKKLTGRPLPTV